jgi:thioredoxin reductase
MQTFDVIIVGGGTAGLSAALVLGRCGRRVLVCDAGRPRNHMTTAIHAFLTRDGTTPTEFYGLARQELARYSSVQLRRGEVVNARRHRDGFEVTLADRSEERSRKLLLATGVVDVLPHIAGIKEMYGRSVFHCPYCDGWELRDRPLVAYGHGAAAYGLSLKLLTWSRDVVLCSDGPAGLKPRQRNELEGHGIALRQTHIERLDGKDGQLSAVVFTNGETLPRTGLFFTVGQYQRSPLAAKLGCRFTKRGVVATGTYETTNIRGLYVAGDASRLVQLAIVAAAEGAGAAFAINTALEKEDLRKSRPSRASTPDRARA